MKTIFFSKHCDDLPEKEIAEQAVPVYHISENAMKTWSIMTTPPGVIAIASPIDYSKLERATPCMPVSVIADSVSGELHANLCRNESVFYHNSLFIIFFK